jgi:2',3'-cyclic-nucleotide 2'-phosphodiesterase (5'-nucleotidase family)
MKKIATTIIIIAIVMSFTMYHNKQHETQTKPSISKIELIEINGSRKNDTMASLIAPYKALKDSAMNIIVGQSIETMEVALPESSLTRLIADILLTEARKTDPNVNMAITNIGGIRRPLYEGNITIGDVFEILPFDNSLLVFEYKGSDILALADAIAQKGGESISGMSLTINGEKAENVKINGQPIDSAKIYKVVTTDYLSWGNDQLEPLANYINSTPLNMMMRDAMFDYVTCATINNQKISAKTDNRIIIKQ